MDGRRGVIPNDVMSLDGWMNTAFEAGMYGTAVFLFMNIVPRFVE